MGEAVPNPIERAFARFEHLSHPARGRTTEPPWNEIGALLDRVEPSECACHLATTACLID